ncbi:hypothetical protein ACVIIV_002810 [Bradyrhizobium sp. USDA 4354]
MIEKVVEGSSVLGGTSRRAGHGLGGSGNDQTDQSLLLACLVAMAPIYAPGHCAKPAGLEESRQPSRTDLAGFVANQSLDMESVRAAIPWFQSLFPAGWASPASPSPWHPKLSPYLAVPPVRDGAEPGSGTIPCAPVTASKGHLALDRTHAVDTLVAVLGRPTFRFDLSEFGALRHQTTVSMRQALEQAKRSASSLLMLEEIDAFRRCGPWLTTERWRN